MITSPPHCIGTLDIPTKGRINLGTFSPEDVGDSNPNLYQTTLPLGALGLTQPISSITFTMPSTATNVAIFAVSGLGGGTPRQHCQGERDIVGLLHAF